MIIIKKHEHPENPEEYFHWVIFGICAASLFLLMASAYVIVRIADGNWANWQLPAILGVAYLLVVTVTAMFFSIKDIKKELEKESAKNKNENESNK